MKRQRYARLVSLNVGGVREIQWLGRPMTTGIWKEPVSDRRRVHGVNVAGDDQADRSVHGGPTKALYAYAVEDYRWWSAQLHQDLRPGTFGDNLTTEAMDLTNALVGERWRIGSAVLRVTEPRLPCYKLGIRMGDPRFPARFAEAARPGTYLAIEEEGELGAGDRIEVLQRPGHQLSIGAVERVYHGDWELLPRLVETEELSEGWRAWAQRRLAARTNASAKRSKADVT